MPRTKKVHSAGRFGARYGLKIRNKVRDIELIQKRKQKCPFCEKLTVKRLASGIWLCNHCDIKFAGKAYEPGLGKNVEEYEVAEIKAKSKED